MVWRFWGICRKRKKEILIFKPKHGERPYVVITFAEENPLYY